ncbi:unnamed protein product [Schistosoma margrebowiei]|uniref:Uncharacterized protein n=1 Tax=Schistosoma margrebowiei TaxID=48269 RepID=A0AA84Z855_9TREM|nr:unnamed protein product [Schistosoma margrebowiei]
MAKSNNSVFDPWNTFYETPEEQAAIKQRAKMRDAMKAEYRKRYTNPFNPPIGHLKRQFQEYDCGELTYRERWGGNTWL